MKLFQQMLVAGASLSLLTPVVAQASDISIEEMNDYQFKLVKIQNEFTWHMHEDTDETFFVLEGMMGIELENETIELDAGEMIVIPRGTKHKPFANEEAK